MDVEDLVAWPVLRQLVGADRSGRGAAVKSRQSKRLANRNADADRVVKSVCPYCAVGCGQNIFVKDGRVVQIEGDPDSPASRGRLCPKGSATLQLTTSKESREEHVLYRRPYGTEWEQLDLETAMQMLADRVLASREEGWQWEEDGRRVRRTMGIASLGGATLDNEENYLIKKLFTALGIIQIENQARVCHSSTVAGLGTSFGRGGATTFPGDLQNSDCIVIQGSNMAEAHPVAYQWVMEAKARGAKLIHVDPRFSRTSALADLYVPLRAGTDIAFLGGIINHVLQTGKYFEEYVTAYTNAPMIITDEFQDTEDLDGVFSGFDPEEGTYDFGTWRYEGTDVQAASGERDMAYGERKGQHSKRSVQHSGHGESHGSGGSATEPWPERDDTLQHPRCVFQLLKRHYARYTPEMVQRTCGVPRRDLPAGLRLDHLQLGPRPHLGVCLRRRLDPAHRRRSVHPGRVDPAAAARQHRPSRAAGSWRCADTPRSRVPATSRRCSTCSRAICRCLTPMSTRTSTRSLRPTRRIAGTGATPATTWSPCSRRGGARPRPRDNDFCFDYLPRLTGSHSTYDTVFEQLAGRCKGYFLMGENPAVGSANTRMQRSGMATSTGSSSATSR